MKFQTKLIEVRDQHKFDEDALFDWMRTTIPSLKGELSVLQFESGQSNPTFLVSGETMKVVLRKKPPGKLLPKAHMVEREYRVMKALASTDVPVPAMYGLCEDESLIGTPFFAMEYLEGRVLFDATLPKQEPAARRAHFKELIRVMAALHKVDHTSVGLEDYGKAGNYFARQISRWSRQYKAAETETIESMDRLCEWLEKNIPEDDRTTLVHGDFRFDNLIFHPEEARGLALVDWELSTLGHPMADLAYTSMGWLVQTPFHGPLGPVASAESGIPTMDEFVADYCELTGSSKIENWNFYLAFSLFRSASIVQGVYKRGLEGNASSQKALMLGMFVKILGDQAWNLVK